MAPLPKPFDAKVHWIKDLLHRGKRAEALVMLEEALADGTAGEETRELADYLRTAKKGRQPFGATHLWYEIGRDNEDLIDQGMSYGDRLKELGVRYLLNPTQIATSLGKYTRAMDEISSIEEENRDR